jgi:hypothetical protein
MNPEIPAYNAALFTISQPRSTEYVLYLPLCITLIPRCNRDSWVKIIFINADFEKILIDQLKVEVNVKLSP